MTKLIKNKRGLIIFLLGLVVLLGAFLRFYDISKMPVSLYWDETASAYNAYSIALTGKDEYGTSFPLLFRSFDDYKAPGNIYLTAIAVSIFGLNEFSARFTSALAGTLTVLLTYYLVREMLELTDLDNFQIFARKFRFNSEHAALLSAFMLAISPWHIQFSRSGFEANVAVMFNVAAVWLFLRAIRLKQNRIFFLSAFMFSVDFYFYRSIWVFVPMLLLGIFIIFFKELVDRKRIVVTLTGLFIFIVILAPFVPDMISKGGMARAAQVDVFNNTIPQQIKAADLRAKGGLWNKIIFNQRLVVPELILTNYVSNFSPQFLFLSGDPNGRHSPRGMGVMYIWEFPFVLVGVCFILFKVKGRLKYLLLLWLLIAPLPAAVSTPNPHALRDLNILPLPQILTALGLYLTYQVIKKVFFQRVFVIAMILIIIGFFINYLYLYYVVTAKVTASDWADGYKQLAEYMIPRESRYQKLVVSGHYWQPYIYFLFYKKYNPSLYQKYGHQTGFGKYVFGGTSWDRDLGRSELNNVNLQKFAGAKHILVALSPGEYQSDKNQLQYLTTIYNHDGQVVFIVGQEQ